MPVVLHCLVWLVGSPFSPRNWEESTVKRVMRFLKFSHFFVWDWPLRSLNTLILFREGKKGRERCGLFTYFITSFCYEGKMFSRTAVFTEMESLNTFRELLRHKMRNPWQFWKAALKFLVESLSQLRNHLSLSFVGSNDRIWASLFLCLFVFSWKHS